MCGTSASADRLLMVHEARVAADELVERFLGLPVAKAMNLGTRAGFDRAVGLLAAQLRRASGRADAAAVREAIAVLDIDWARTTAAERRRLVAEAMAAAGRATAIVPARKNQIGRALARFIRDHFLVRDAIERRLARTNLAARLGAWLEDETNSARNGSVQEGLAPDDSTRVGSDDASRCHDPAHRRASPRAQPATPSPQGEIRRLHGMSPRWGLAPHLATNR